MEEYKEWADLTAAKIRKKMSWVSDKNKEKLPYTTDETGNYDDRSDSALYPNPADGIGWWTNGFWGGMMWLLYEDTREEKYRTYAKMAEDRLARALVIFDGLHHDVGFQFVPTSFANYRLTKDPTARSRAIHAANLLAGRFNPQGQFIRAWNDLPGSDTRGWAIIDCMMNLSLLYLASEETKDPRFRQIAMCHADTVRKHFVREDGSVIHIGVFDPESGAFLKSLGGQGYAEGSSWTRGQGWGIYGFMISYLHTGKAAYLDTAKKIADYILKNIPESGLIPVDFRQPAEPAWEDSCGACIIAGGLIELSRCVSEEERENYLAAAVKILRVIDSFRADYSEKCDAIVTNCSGAYHDKRHHFTMNYADYYYMEAIFKLRGEGIFIW